MLLIFSRPSAVPSGRYSESVPYRSNTIRCVQVSQSGERLSKCRTQESGHASLKCSALQFSARPFAEYSCLFSHAVAYAAQQHCWLHSCAWQGACSCRLLGRLRARIHADFVRIIIIYTPDCLFPLTCKKWSYFVKKCSGDGKNVHFLHSQVSGQKVTEKSIKRCRKLLKNATIAPSFRDYVF